jgi:dihydrofolate reductase
MNAIVIVDKNWGIGRDGGLLVHLPGDLKYFKEKTWGKVTVQGRKTLESFPGAKPLPGRTNVILTRNEEFKPEGCVVLNSKEAVMKYAAQFPTEDIFISGGAEIYNQFLDDCDTFYVTKIYDEFEADRYFPNLDELGMEVTWESEMQEEKGISYQFLKYNRVK